MLNLEMVELKINQVKLEKIGEVASQIISYAKGVDVWIFEGDMGAGKTTLIKAICEKIGVVDNVHSPTFSIVNEYINENDDKIYHFDFYRIENEKEALDIGCDEYFYSEQKCFIEWPSKILNLIPDNRIEINISIVDEFTRSINVLKHV
ncbi:MAG: tRNA (adenosine(37)-N6)-threonylcarbamoyltransferase complex ATPase subunit type 1 TsaE [Cyclobacteriaceae bacterium]|nr:tRNA (adenosine(37)-N6)-threonylcarbamoyltransferase complex ATPase subunit type 1 TsaE [Cyclobacteriaceae bacterium]